MLTDKEVKIESGQYTVEEGILHVKIEDKDSEGFNMNDAKEHISTYSRFRKLYGSIPEILDLRNFNSLLDVEILKHIGLQSYKQKKNQGPRAYIIKSMTTLMQLDLFLKLSINGYFTQIFECEVEAKKWLSEFVKE
ncbi:MAG: hypothetical protein HKN22_03305 [Bacteroidia bacterium]|nr:hypothetical protein [Bacteroidia bacterium]